MPLSYRVGSWYLYNVTGYLNSTFPEEPEAFMFNAVGRSTAAWNSCFGGAGGGYSLPRIYSVPESLDVS